MSNDPIDHCARCGAVLCGEERMHDLCPACRDEDRSPAASGGLKTYLVSWQIDVDAVNTTDAARQALAIQRDPTSTATFFVVRPIGDDEPEVELDLLGGDSR